MKKVLCILLSLLFCVSLLSGCADNEGPYQRGEKLYDAVEDDNINDIKETLPKKIVVTVDKSGEQKTIKISKEDYIKQLVNAFADIKIGKNSQSPATDNYNKIEFIWADDESSVISLCRYDIEVKEDGKSYCYKLKGLESFFKKAIEISESKGKITPSETAGVEFEKYTDNDINIDIPKGWYVEVLDGVTPDFYTFMVYSRADERYRLYFNMKNEGCPASQKDKDFWMRWYSSSPFAKLPVVNPHNCEGYYKVFNAMQQNNTDYFTFPTINEFSIVEKLGTNTTGGDIVRATCKDESNNKLDGIFTTTVKPVSLYYAKTTSIYGSTFYTAPEGMLIEWQPIFNKMLDSFSFTEEFTEKYYNTLKQTAKSSSELSKTLNETSDIITKGWEARQSTYDKISQKQSDATLGYERVYDVETGDIYKAQNGFMDGYSGSDLKPITDDMYNLPIAGYIE